MDTAFISVDYDEYHPETYRGVVVYVGDTATRFMAGGLWSIDFECALEFAKREAIRVFCSSDCDNFRSDLKKSQSNAAQS